VTYPGIFIDGAASAAADARETTLRGGEGGRTGTNGTAGRPLVSQTGASTREVRRPEGRR